MKLPAIRFPAFRLPLMGSSTPGLILRTGEVELLAMQGRKVTSRVRVPIEGKREDVDIVRAVQYALGAAELKTKKLAVSIPTADVLFRFFTMPVIPKPEWESAVQFEARKYIPFKIEELVWDYQVISTKSSDRLEVIFTAVQRETLERLQRLLSEAGVEPTRIEPRSLSLARLIQDVRGKGEQTFTCLVDVEAESAHLAIVRNGLPFLTRDISFSSGTQALSSLPSSTAEVGQGLATPIPETTAGTMEPKSQRLLSELSVSLDFFMREYPSSTISHVVLFGDETVVGPWCKGLSEQLHSSVELGHSFVERRVDGELQLSMASALGLLQGSERSGNASLDFLQRAQVKAASVAAKRVKVSPLGVEGRITALIQALRIPSTMLWAMPALGALLTMWWLGYQQVEGASRQLHQIVTARPARAGGINKLTQEQLKAMKDKMQTQVSLLRELLEAHTIVSDKLDALVRIIPNGVWFTSFSYQNPFNPSDGKSRPSLVINGACFLKEPGEELGAIQQFEDQIKRNPKFFNGFATERLGQITARVHTAANQQYTYQTFQLDCNADRRL